MSAVNNLVETIRAEGAKNGLTLHRYQSNKGHFSCVITYATHSGSERPAFSRDCDGPYVTLTQREGTTENCEAYRKLSKLLKAVS